MKKLLVTFMAGIAIFFTALSAYPADAKVTVRTYTFSPYGLKADVYMNNVDMSPLPGPAILLIHGGGWGAGDRTEFRDLAHWLARQGSVPIAIDYRLSTSGAQWPAQAQDVEQAVWWIRENAAALKINPDRVVAIGGSAGGHLAAWLATTERKNAKGISSRVNQVVSIWGPWDLTVPDIREDGKNMIAALVGNQNPRVASPLFHVDGNTAPTLLIHGTKDDLVPPDQSMRACARIKAAGVKCELVLLEGEGHGFSVNPDYPALVAKRVKDFIATGMDAKSRHQEHGPEN